MRIGVISEGHSDRAVIANVIVGATGIDRSSIVALRPSNTLDETDKAIKDPKGFSSWSVVKGECEKRELIDEFLALEGQDFVVIHLDSAESEHYGVKREPDKKTLREIIIKQVNEWLKEDIFDKVLYAIAIEEIDAWVLTIYDKSDSTNSAKPKEKLSRVFGKKGLNSSTTFDNYLMVSKSLSKIKEIEKEKYLSYNHSLEAFFKEVQTKVLPKLNE